MSIKCTRCDGTGFLNVHQLPDELLTLYTSGDVDAYYVLDRLRDLPISKENVHAVNDISICDCCGDGSDWYHVPGEHYNDDVRGPHGPYAYHNGLCECH